MAKILMIVAQQGFKDAELLVPKGVLEKAGHSVKVASITRGTAYGADGAQVQPDMAAYEVNPDFFDAIVVVGGPGSPALAENDEVLRIVRGAGEKKKVVAAICLGPMALANCGVLMGKEATVFPDRKAIKLLRDNGATYLVQHVVKADNVLTADSPASASEFAKMLVDMLKK